MFKTELRGVGGWGSGLDPPGSLGKRFLMHGLVSSSLAGLCAPRAASVIITPSQDCRGGATAAFPRTVL